MSTPMGYRPASPHGVRLTAFVPMTPLLFRHLSGAADPLAELREAAVDAVRTVCFGADRVLVLCPVGGREAPGDWHDPTRSGPVHGGPRSLARTVAEHLLDLAEVRVPVEHVEATDGEADFRGLLDPRVNTALLVLGDGAAARGQGAPGHIDERSFAFDDAVAEAFATGNAEVLAALASAPEAEELMVTGRHAWPVAARLVSRDDSGWLQHRSDPFGLTYFVVVW